jgi:hypothetical protein
MVKDAPRKAQRSAPPVAKTIQTPEFAKTNLVKWVPVGGALLLALALVCVYNHIFSGAFSGQLYITVKKIDEFPNNAGFMDTTDPFVEIQVGNQTHQTVPRDNAGGRHVSIDETLSFNNRLLEKMMKVKVYDNNLISHTLLGEADVDLNWQRLVDDEKSSIPVQLFLGGQAAGKVILMFSRRAPPKATSDTQHAQTKLHNSTDGVPAISAVNAAAVKVTSDQVAADNATTSEATAPKVAAAKVAADKEAKEAKAKVAAPKDGPKESRSDSNETSVEGDSKRAHLPVTEKPPASYLGVVAVGVSVLLLVGRMMGKQLKKEPRDDQPVSDATDEKTVKKGMFGSLSSRKSATEASKTGASQAKTAAERDAMGHGRSEIAPNTSPATVKNGMFSSLFNRKFSIQSAAPIEDKVEQKVQKGLPGSLFWPQAHRSAPNPHAVNWTNDPSEQKPTPKTFLGALTDLSSRGKIERSNGSELQMPAKKSWFGGQTACPEKMAKTDGTVEHTKPKESFFSSPFSKKKAAAQVDDTSELDQIEDLRGLLGYLFSSPPETSTAPQVAALARTATPKMQRSSAPSTLASRRAASVQETAAGNVTKAEDSEDMTKSVGSTNRRCPNLVSVSLLLILNAFLACSLGSAGPGTLDCSKGSNAALPLTSEIAISNDTYLSSLISMVSGITISDAAEPASMNESATGNSSFLESFGSLMAKVSASVSSANSSVPVSSNATYISVQGRDSSGLLDMGKSAKALPDEKTLP